MKDPEKGIQVLLNLGLTPLQAKVYIGLVHLGKAKVQTISRTAILDRSNTYQIIAQLQNLGLVEKILGKPNTYEAKSFQDGISILLDDHKKQYDKIRKVAKEFLNLAYEYSNDSNEPAGKFSVSLVSGLKAGSNEYSRGLKNAKTSLDCICIEWKQVVHWFNVFQEDYRKALSRGVKMRFIAQIPDGEKMPQAARRLLGNGLFEIRSTRTVAHAGINIWDKKTVHIVTFTGYPNGLEVIKSSSPALVEFAQDFFETKWSLAKLPCWQSKIEIQAYLE